MRIFISITDNIQGNTGISVVQQFELLHYRDSRILANIHFDVLIFVQVNKLFCMIICNRTVKGRNYSLDYQYGPIIGICFVLGLITGSVMYLSDFCIAGMFRDLFLLRRSMMLRYLALLVVSSMILFELARQMGFLSLYPFPLLYSPTPANLIGGFLFGAGMVLAGGCVFGTLYKMGSGSVLSATAFLGLVAGSGLYAEIHPFWASFVRGTTFFQGRITIPQILGVDPLIPISFASVAGLVFIRLWVRNRKLFRLSYAKGYLQPWKAALLLSLIGLSSYALIGMPLGVTTSCAKLSGYLGSLFFKEHIDGLSYFHALSLNYMQPLTGLRLQGGPGPRVDAFSAIQFPLVAGIVFGSAASATWLKEFHIHFGAPPRQYVSAFSGGVIMGLASRMAPTCNVWHLLGGLPILAASSILFLLGLFPGAWVGSRIFAGLVMKEGETNRMLTVEKKQVERN